MANVANYSADLGELQKLSTHISGVLDRWSVIDGDKVKLSNDNVKKLNALYGDTIDLMNKIVDQSAIILADQTSTDTTTSSKIS